MAKKEMAAVAESGIQPLELRYQPMLGTFSPGVIGYRTKTVVYSLDLGTLTEPDYAYAVDSGNETGIRLSEWNISEAIRHLELMKKEGLGDLFIMARCTASFANTPDAYDRVKRLITAGKLENPANLWLEFPQSVLYAAEENGRQTMLDLKTLGVKTILSGCGAADCPLSKMMEIPPDYVLLEPGTTTLVHDRNKPEVLAKLCQYLKSMNLKVCADGIENDEQIRDLVRMDCQGVIAADTYHGTHDFTDGDLTLEEVLAHREEGEEDGT